MTETTATVTGFIDLEDARLRFWERGSGETTVLLCHAGAFSDWFAPVFDEPALDNVRLIRVHRAGYGDSSAPSGLLTYSDHARHCRDLLHQLGAERAYWVGHSSSGSMGLQAAMDEPDLLAGLILLDSAPSPAGPSAEAMVQTTVGPAIGTAQAGDVATAIDIFLSGAVGPDWSDCVRRALGENGMDQLYRDAAFFLGNEILSAPQWSIDADAASRIKAPVLLAYGGEGWRVTRVYEETSRALLEMLPDAKLLKVPGVGHGMPLEHPARVAELIGRTVERWSTQR